MKYELVALSVTIKGKTFRKSEKKLLDDDKLPKPELLAAYERGFIKPEGSKAKNPTEVQAQYLKEYAAKTEKVDSDLPEEIPFREKLIENKILTLDQLNKIDDLTELKGIGKASEKEIKEFLKTNE